MLIIIMKPIYISGNNAENNAVIIGLEDWQKVYKRQCILYLLVQWTK